MKLFVRIPSTSNILGQCCCYMFIKTQIHTKEDVLWSFSQANNVLSRKQYFIALINTIKCETYKIIVQINVLKSTTDMKLFAIILSILVFVAIMIEAKVCPKLTPVYCIWYNEICKRDADCKRGEICCDRPYCGTYCY